MIIFDKNPTLVILLIFKEIFSCTSDFFSHQNASLEYLYDYILDDVCKTKVGKLIVAEKLCQNRP